MERSIERSLLVALAIASCAACRPATAQGATPYAGLETREIKALSPEQIEAFISGAGMGMALAAELNRHPGPKHVLELSENLDLTAEQTQLTNRVFDSMRSAAVDLGLRIVELEADLDASFAARSLSEEELEARVAEIAGLLGQLRFVHLRAHLQMDQILTPHQVEMYVRIRGYGAGGHTDHPAGHDHASGE